jgi:hypothetical protein
LGSSCLRLPNVRWWFLRSISQRFRRTYEVGESGDVWIRCICPNSIDFPPEEISTLLHNKLN